MVMKRQERQNDAEPLKEMGGRQGTQASSRVNVGFAATPESACPSLP